MNSFVHQLPGRIKYTNVKLTRPVNADTAKIAAWFAVDERHRASARRRRSSSRTTTTSRCSRGRSSACPGALDGTVAVGRLGEGRHRDAGARPPRLPRRAGLTDGAADRPSSPRPSSTCASRCRTASTSSPGRASRSCTFDFNPKDYSMSLQAGWNFKPPEEAGRARRSSPAPSCGRSTSRCSSTPPTSDARRRVADRRRRCLDGAADREVDQRRARRSRRSSCSRGATSKPFVGVVKSVTVELTLFRPYGPAGAGHVQGLDAGVRPDARRSRTRRRARCAAPAPTASCSATRWRRSPTPSTARRRCGGRSPRPTSSRTRSTSASARELLHPRRPPTPPPWPEDAWPRNARPTSSRSRSTARRSPTRSPAPSSRRSSRTRSTCPTRSSSCSATRCARCSRRAASRSARSCRSPSSPRRRRRARRSSTARSPPSRPRSSATGR